jgi:cytochrome P450
MTSPVPRIIPTPGDLSCDRIVHKVLASFDLNDCDVIKLAMPTPFHVFCLRNPEHIKFITTCEEAATEKPPHTVPKADWLMGNGLFNDLGGDSWKAKRLQVNPAFSQRHSAYFCELLPEFLEKLKVRWAGFGRDQPIDLHDEILRMVLDFAVFAMFSKRLDADGLQWITEAVEFCEEMFATISPLWLPTSANLKLRKVGRQFNGLMQQILEEWRSNQAARADVLHFLMRDGGRSEPHVRDEEVRAAMFSSLLGAPAAALPILWALYFFTVRPDTLREVRAELFNVIGPRTPRPEELPKLKYLDMFFKEILRIYPPFWGSLRYSKEAVAFDGYSFPARSIFAMMRAAAHRHPRYWQQPGKFVPERFSSQNPDPGCRRAYIPFGWGPRLCLGRYLAALLCPIAIAFIAQNFECQIINPDEPIELKYWFAMYPARKMLATVRPVGGAQRSVAD